MKRWGDKRPEVEERDKTARETRPKQERDLRKHQKDKAK